MAEVKVPDIGDFMEVEVIEVLVKPGDTVAKEQSLISLESDKATMEIPSPGAGVVKELKVKVGDKVSKGSLILLMEMKEAAATETPKSVTAKDISPLTTSTKSPFTSNAVAIAPPPPVYS